MPEVFGFTYESIERLKDYAVVVSKFDNGSDQVQLKHSQPAINYRLQSPILSKTAHAAYETFFDTVQGAFVPFQFTDPYNDTTYNCRIVPGSFRSRFTGGVFVVTIDIEVIW